MTQGYLICTSVLLVWQLSRFDEYTSFSLLLALAFYDLCAVLSPCGPLKALVGLMQERNIPLPVNCRSCDDRLWCSERPFKIYPLIFNVTCVMQGLLYEANLSRKSSFDGSNRTSRASSCGSISRSRGSSFRNNSRNARNWLLRQPLDEENSPTEIEIISPMECRDSITRRNVLAVSDVTLNSYHTEATALFRTDCVDVEEKCSTDLGLSDGIRTIDMNTVMSKGDERMSSKSASARLSLKYISFPNSSRSSQSSSVSSPLEAQYRSQKEGEDTEFNNLQKSVNNGNDNDVDVDVDVDTSVSSSSSSSTPSGKCLTIHDYADRPISHIIYNCWQYAVV